MELPPRGESNDQERERTYLVFFEVNFGNPQLMIWEEWGGRKDVPTERPDPVTRLAMEDNQVSWG